MKRKLQIAVVAAVLALPFGCATLLPEPTAQDAVRSNAMWPGVKLEDLREGRKLYAENCAACHNLHIPSELESAQWERIMVKMQIKAKINDGTKDTIMKYLLTFAKTSE